MSDALEKAREYEARYEVFIDPGDRPAWHLTPRVGWMNDPNGFSYYKGAYHLFYQYHPYSTKWGPMHWGHAVSSDLLRWRYLPCALAPGDEGCDKDGCFSGSALELPDGRQLLMYTGNHNETLPDGSSQVTQTQCLAVGDGLDYQKYEANPVLTARDIPEGFSGADFRDPRLWREPDGTYACVAGCRTDDGSGSILLFRSEDAFHWRFDRVLERCWNEYGKMWECPDYFTLDGMQVLLTSPQDMTQLGLEFHNGNNTLCLLGRVDPETGSFRRESAQSLDYGLDFYATQTCLTPDGRRVAIGWMQNWDACVCPPDARWFGQMSAPRELAVRNGRLVQNPVRELEALRGRRVSYTGVPVCEETTLAGVFGRLVDMTVDIAPQEPGSFRKFEIKAARGSRHYTSVVFDAKESSLRLNRAHAGFNRDFVHERKCQVRSRDGRCRLRILLDRSSIEIFVNDGEQVMSAVIYTPQTADGISFVCDGKALMNVEKYDLRA